MSPRWLTILLVGVGLLTACNAPEPTRSPAPDVAPTPISTAIPTPRPTATPTPTPVPTPTPEPVLTYYERAWQHRVEASFRTQACPAPPDVTYPADYYQGRLIDTHLHMPQLPDTPLGFEEGERELEGFAGSRYSDRDDFDEPDDGSFPSLDQLPIAGQNITLDAIACTLQAEGTERAFSYFAVFSSQPDSVLEIARLASERYAGLFVPFVNPPGEIQGVTSVGGTRLREMLSAYPDVFKGYGEVRLTTSDAPLLMTVYPVAEEHGLMVYMHPEDGQTDNLARALAAHPNVTFVVHGDQTQDDIGSLMDAYPNVYYTVDALVGDQYLLHPREDAASFLSKTNDYGPLLEIDVGDWKEVIEAHADRFMWGTDRGGIVLWAWDLEVGLRLTDYARAFIGRLDPGVQELFAYRNAERLIDAAGLGGR